MKNLAFELFLLSTNLSQLKSKILITKLFIESINSFFAGHQFSWSTEECNIAETKIQVCTRFKNYGYIHFYKKSAFTDENFSLLQNAVQLLAIQLEKIDQEELLNNQKEHLNILVQEKTKDLIDSQNELINKNNEIERQNKELKGKNTFIQTILDNLPIGLALNSFDNNEVVYTNKKFEEIYGWNSEEVTSITSFSKKVYPDKKYRKKLIEQVTSDINSGDATRMHWENIQITTSTGSKKIVNAVNIPLKEQNTMVSTVMDFSALYNTQLDLLKAKDKAEENEEKYKQIFDNTFDVMSIYEVTEDNRYKVITFNQAEAKLIGNLENFQNRYIDECIPPELYNEFKQHYERCIKEDRRIEYEENISFLNVDRTFNTQLIPLKNAEGRIHRIIVISRDISENKNLNIQLARQNEELKLLNYDITIAKEKAEESEAKFRQMSELLPQIVFEADMLGNLTYVNKQAYKLSGYSEQDSLIGKSTISFYIPADRIRAVENIKLSIAGKKNALSNGYTMLRKNGSTFPVLVYSNPILKEDQPTGLRGIIVDISELKMAENEIIKLNEELEQRVASRTSQLELANKELESFSYSVSHDLRTPLRALDGFANILLEDYAPLLDDEGKRLLRIIIANANKMGTLIDDLLAFSRLGRQEMQFAPIDMHAMANSAYNELVADTDTIDFRLHQIPETNGDPALLRQVWLNFISNAIKFSAKKLNRIIEVGTLTSGTEIIYFIKDNGAGFNMDYSNKLFAVFQRLHSPREFEGTGIGLSFVQRIIQRHGGRVWAEGKVEEGATFYFTLPRNV